MQHRNPYGRILLPILIAALSLGACAAPDNRTGAAPSATTTSATGEPIASADVPTPLIQFDNDSASATATATPLEEATPDATAGTAAPTALVDSAPITTTATAIPISKIDETDPFTGTDVLSDTDELSGTAAIETGHPVAQAIGEHFGVPADEIMDQHREGLGFGEIARAYFLARELAADDDPTNDLTADQILAMHQAGAGWGQIVQTLGLPHGNRTRNLGQIMSGRARGTDNESTTAAPLPNEPAGKTKIDAPKVKSNNGNHGNNGNNGKNRNPGNGGNNKGDKGKKGK